MDLFLGGAVMMASLVASIFFFRSWRQSHDWLFFHFGMAFWLMSLERLVLAVGRMDGEAHFSIYILRLLAFLLIIYAVMRKNMDAPPPPADR